MTVPARLHDLVDRFRNDLARLTSAGYQEMEARVEFIDPLLELLGWDMTNAKGLPNGLKEVVREETPTSAAGLAAGRPDYTFRIAATRKFFVEAKKPSVDITTHQASAFQVRSYGYTVGLPVSILTNFRTLRIYNTTLEPKATEDVDVGLIDSIDFEDLPARFAELFARFGRDAVAAGSLEHYYGSAVSGAMAVSEKFLERINSWRVRLATDLSNRYPALTLADLSDLAQKVVNRIIFIRMCEDRGIEGFELLRKVAHQRSAVKLRGLFKKFDDRYNTGLFDVATDSLQSAYELDAGLFMNIVEEVYSPFSPYNCAVLDADFLGQVYELFLASRLHVGATGIELVRKPDYEDREVVTTPQALVDGVIQRAFDSKLSLAAPATFEQLCALRVLDIAVGSGRFLVHALDKLVDVAIAILSANPHDPRVHRISPTDLRLRFQEKRQLLESCLYGIDIDYNAVEVARFGLMVKLLEDESAGTLPNAKKILPDLTANIVYGNTVVSDDFTGTAAEVAKTVPMSWAAEGLPAQFDVVVGNPPYVSTEAMQKANKAEVSYYKTHYQSCWRQFDRYFVFIEKALSSLAPQGAAGLLVPNKWLTIESGAKLRGHLKSHVSELVDFGNENLFAGRSAYVCILVLQLGGTTLNYRNVHHQADFEQDPANKGFAMPRSKLAALAEQS